jgi:threonylcarbamoyladenosine tRNA methylthiotransferase MtaB
MARFSITTLGCKVNQYDGAALRQALTGAGLAPVRVGEADPEVAAPDSPRAPRGRGGPGLDLVAVNTCCVTATAMRKSRQAVRRAVRGAPHAAVLVTGCYCDYDPRRIRDVLASLGVPPERTVIAGHHDDVAASVLRAAAVAKMNVNAPVGPPEQAPRPRARAAPSFPAPCANRADDLRTRRRETLLALASAAEGLPSLRAFDGHQRAFVKVQDGCDAFCAYCVVPYLRCRVRSRDIEAVVRECRDLVAAGHKEVVLCGVFLGAYGRTTTIRRTWNGQPAGLPDLLRRVAAIEGLWRVRLSSLEPGDLDAELLATLRELPNFAPHLHLPLQSGSAKVLRRMNRQYTLDDFRRAVDLLRATLDRPAITTDIIVGFPGETDEDFARTLDAARCAGFAKIHAFPFSPVEGTAAWTHRREAPPPRVVRERINVLAEVERELAAAYRGQFVGETMEGLVETPARDGAPGEAMTDRYLSVFFDAGIAGPGQVGTFRITGTRDNGLAGQLV